MMKKIVVAVVLGLNFVGSNLLFAQSPEDAAVVLPARVVKAIEVKGNKTIGISTILTKIKTRVGQDYLESVISDDLKRLYNMGAFSDVTVDRKDHEGGVKVIFNFVEKPIVENVTFSRIRYWKPKQLSTKMKTRKGKFLDKKSLRDDEETIKELYVKKGLTTALVEVETDIDAATNKAKVHFIINEGGRLKISQIKVEGNKAFKDGRIIKIIKTRKAWLFGSGLLKEDLLEEDMERVAAFYEKEGFIDAKASYTILYPRKDKAVVTIQIVEGTRYFVGDIAISGNKIASESEIRAAIVDTKVGGPFSREKLSGDIGKIRTLYFDKGYIFARAEEASSLNPSTGKVSVKITVDEGTLAYVNKVRIQGNTRTRDIVIRRELRLHPGDQFDGSKLRRSKERLRNLGYFEDINYDIEDTSIPDKKDLVVQVKEAKTGSFSFGGGYSTVDQIVGFVEIEQKNFDFTAWPNFTGGGQDLSVRVETGSTRRNLYLSFTEPWLFDYPISAGFDLYRTSRERERNTGYAYDEKRLGGDIRFGKQFTEFVSGRLTYRNEEITIDNLDDGVSADLLAEEGSNTVSSVGLSLSYDTRDNVFSPKQGWYLTGTTDVAGGPLGGEKDFYRVEGRASYYIPLKFNTVLELRTRTGIIQSYGDSDKVPIFERFFAGGSRTIRGYNERKVGPLDPITEDPIGGEALLIGNLELTYPILDFLKIATFFDAGNVWPTVEDYGAGDFKSGAGLGLRIKTPIGPVNLDYGYPLNDEAGEDERSPKFYFSVSRGF